MDNYFTINLGILSSTLYGWRSLEVTVREGPKARSRMLNSKFYNIRELHTPGNIKRQELTQVSIPTLNPSSNQEPKSSSVRQTMLILQKNRNTTLSIKRLSEQNHVKPIDTPKCTTGHFIELHREDIQVHPPKQRYKLPQPGNLDKSLVQTLSQGENSTIKRNNELPACRKDTPNKAI